MPLVDIPPPGFFVPTGFFLKAAIDPKQALSTPATVSTAPKIATTSNVAVPVFKGSFTQVVTLYASASNKAYFAKAGLDATTNARAWEVLLRKYKIPYKQLTTIEQLEKAPLGVLLLPSAAALSEAERKAIAAYREQGGSVLSTWLTGVRSDQGTWLGFEFMESTLGVKVVGTTEPAADDGFMIMHGSTPVSHTLPAGLRVWLERVKGWYPLSLVGKNAAANMMPWSRTFVPDKPSSVITYDERAQASGARSRSVVLGYPERLWQTADPKVLEAIAHNALMWLLRQPDAYLSPWPAPYTSAFVTGVDSADVLVSGDVAFAKRLEDVGGRASYYLLTDPVAKSVETAKKLQSKGHELAYLADKFEGFQGQTAAVQMRRLEAMQKKLGDVGLDTGVAPGFRPPMGSADATTQKVAADKGFGHYIGNSADTETRLPFVIGSAEGSSKSLVGIPNTQTGPEEWLDDPDAEDGLQAFLDELALSLQMGGVSFVRFSNQTLLAPDQLDAIFDYLKEQKTRTWMASGGQVADWWRERERLSARLNSGPVAPILSVAVSAGLPLKNPVSILVNAPDTSSSLRLVSVGSNVPVPRLLKLDSWRSAVIIDGLAPGMYQWYVYFDKATGSTAK
ncbi:hypothetical protein [Rhodoferax aquaticus]|uniref:NodB homology domain-containing protein n=1 Tax=Rhodoferax aquaticus TaxID=2527691 RepID=A0A515EKG0_9BURK|nr:hypothetical protein [Rhodoferax aquaticus]QDL53089.1 hypothetical protein EXZ61_02280 [Rhodoferax aquaticus]